MKYNFIFIDDDDTIRETMQYIADWKNLGFNYAASFATIGEALRYMEENEVELVISDVLLNGETGLELAELMQKEYPSVLLILISAHRDFEYVRKALQYNVFSYLTKPTSSEEITKVMENAREKIDKLKSLDSVSSFLYNEVKYNSIVKEAVVYINEHFKENITRDDVANYLSINPQYFSRYFKKFTGKKFVEYLNEVRIAHAIHLLETTNMKIYEICYACNYKNNHYFLNMFKKQTGMTPYDYRKKFRGDDSGDLEEDEE